MVREGAAKLQSQIWLASNAPAAAAVSGAGRRDFPLGLQNLPSVFKRPLQPLAFKLPVSWDPSGCSLYFGRSARYPSWVHEQVGSASTYLTAIFLTSWFTYFFTEIFFFIHFLLSMFIIAS